MSDPENQKAENTDKYSVFSLFQAGDERIEKNSSRRLTSRIPYKHAILR